MTSENNPAKASLGRKIGKWILRILGGLVFLVLIIFLVAWLRPLPGDQNTPFGVDRNYSVYVPAADGARIAVDIWLPAGLTAADKIPAIMEGTRYWRASPVTLPGRVMGLFGQQVPGAAPSHFASYFMDKGYAYLTVDVRGTGASFGVHDTEYSLQEMADYSAILDWIIEQPWSNGSVGSVGVSYSGTTAELMTTTRHSALKAAAPLYSDFDAQYHLVTPGGVYQPAFVDLWSDMVSAMDRNDICALSSLFSEQEVTGTACTITEWVAGGVKPVDGPEGKKLLEEAVAEHNSPEVKTMISQLEYRDSPVSSLGYSSMENNAYGRKEAIESSGIPLYIVAGWMDAATADGALARFAAFDNPQSVYIAPFSHGGGNDTDPYKAADGQLAWSTQEQMDRLEHFFAAYLKEEGTPPELGLNYYIMGAGSWKQTAVWPPEGFDTLTYYLRADNQLSAEMPTEEAAADGYTVDFGVGTASTSRWMTQLGGGDVVYDRNRPELAKLLTYQTEPFEQDMELTGTVVLDLWLASDRPDGVVHAYLEDVAPDGTIRYLTEGVLRLKHRKVSEETPFYPTFGPYHSYLEKDAEPMPLGEPQQVSMGLYATSALIKAGHRLQVRISGADATTFERIPKEGPAPQWEVFRSSERASQVRAPVREW